MNRQGVVTKINNSRRELVAKWGGQQSRRKSAAEGGCGVIGLACSEPVAGRHLLQALTQMRNRGNGKGGGIAAVGLVAEQFGVTRKVLEKDYLLAVAYLDPEARTAVEAHHIHPFFEVDHTYPIPTLADYTVLEGLEVKPPEVCCYFVRPRAERLADFRKEHGLEEAADRAVEDEFVYQNSYRLNREFYTEEENRAFVLSHAKNLLVLKMVGYGDDVVRYYRLEDFRAHVWIGHHRYPTKGKVWHPGGAHPFIGLNEALVHNGDFANYASVAEYLAQRNIYPLYQTDTEVSALVFDLHQRTYGYPLEYTIESLAPTTERDYGLLPPDKQLVYGQLQQTHIHGSPDGPWFFLVAQSAPEGAYRLIGITDTSMLRPQVFALQQGQVSLGFAASEKQSIDAALASLAASDPRIWTRADRYWNARGGSHTDGGAFIFEVSGNPDNGGRSLACTNKFGQPIGLDHLPKPYGNPGPVAVTAPARQVSIRGLEAAEVFAAVVGQLEEWDYGHLLHFLQGLEQLAEEPEQRARTIEIVTLLLDRCYPTGRLRRSSLLSLLDDCLANIFASIRHQPDDNYMYLSLGQPLPEPATESQTLILDGAGYPQEGPDSLALAVVAAYQAGWRKLIVINTRGHRFIANGLGPATEGLRIEVYGPAGDYLASGLDGAQVHLHGDGQDQLGQILKAGTLVVHGDVGQTFMYGAKGGEVFVLGNAAGRPLINAVGKPRVVINGTCLDYLAESFMAGDPLEGGGFVILNAITFDDNGEIIDLPEPYPGGNLFSLASGGAIYVRDPHRKLTQDQLNGGEFAPLTEEDWQLILPYLEANERHFGIPVNRLLEVEGQGQEEGQPRPPGRPRRPRRPEEVYRKIRPVKHKALQAEEAWVTEEG